QPRSLPPRRSQTPYPRQPLHRSDFPSRPAPPRRPGCPLRRRSPNRWRPHSPHRICWPWFPAYRRCRTSPASPDADPAPSPDPAAGRADPQAASYCEALVIAVVLCMCAAVASAGFGTWSLSRNQVVDTSALALRALAPTQLAAAVMLAAGGVVALAASPDTALVV